MAEDVAVLLGAGEPEPIVIAGKKCYVRPLGIKELTELEKVCLKSYRRSFVETFSDCADLLPEAMQVSFIREKMEEAARFDLSSLPPKHAYDPKAIVLTDDMKKWVDENLSGLFPDDEQMSEKIYRGLIVGALDDGTLKEDEYISIVKSPIKKTLIGYAQWWVNGTFDGRLGMCEMAFRNNGVTKEEIQTEFSNNPGLMGKIARSIELLSVPQPGNT